MPKFNDLTGQRFERILKYGDKDKAKRFVDDNE